MATSGAGPAERMGTWRGRVTALVLTIAALGSGCSEPTSANTIDVPEAHTHVSIPAAWSAVERDVSERSSVDSFRRSWRIGPEHLLSIAPYYGCVLSLVTTPTDEPTPEAWLERYDTYPSDQIVAQRLDDFDSFSRASAVQVAEAMPQWTGTSIYIRTEQTLWRLQYTDSADYDNLVWSEQAEGNALGCRMVARNLLGTQ